MSGYDGFFKAAKNARQPDLPKNKSKAKFKTRHESKATAKSKNQSANQHVDQTVSEEDLRTMFKMASNRKKKKEPVTVPWLSLALSFVALSMSAYYLINPVFFEKLFSRIEISATAMASAASGEEKSSRSKDEVKAKTAPEGKSELNAGSATEVTKDLSYISKLTERNNELDLREKELNELEEELHRQRAEVEVQIKRLEGMRRQIASVLNERVEIDEEKVTKLVDVYSSMKPKQAAEIIATLNEDLAVEVLGRMKKKDAAGILNLIEAKKAQSLSEKYTGYKSR